MKLVVVGLLVENDRVLVQRRPDGERFAGLWELPGGKVEDGETMRFALAREWREELNLTVSVGELVTECVVTIKEKMLLLPLFRVERQEPCLEAKLDGTTGCDGQLVRMVTWEELQTLPAVPSMERYLPTVGLALHAVAKGS